MIRHGWIIFYFRKRGEFIRQSERK
jgi:hypothetical protein